MPLRAAVEKSERWMIQCASLVDGVSFPTTHRGRIAVSLHHLCIEHHTGIHTLVDNAVIGSAFALFRPLFEAYVRGVWYHLCADEQQVTAFLAGEEPPRIASLIEQLETKEAFEEGSLARMKKQVWRNLNDFTHGGTIQVKARNTGDEIVQNYKSEHVASLLTAAATLSLLAGVGIAAVVKLDSLAVALREAYRTIYESAA